MEAVAARAGVSKPTVYRWWPDRHAVTMAALMESELPGARNRRSESPVQALLQQLRGIVNTLGSRTGRNVATLIAAADPDTELSKAFRNHFVLARREEGRTLLKEAAEPFPLGDPVTHHERIPDQHDPFRPRERPIGEPQALGTFADVIA